MSNKLNGLLCLPEPQAITVDQDDNQLQAAED
jgi:hypothetical protein